VLFTDGVLEAIANDEFEAEEKLRTFTERKWGELEEEIEGFYKEEQKQAQSDDMCLIMIQTKPINKVELLARMRVALRLKSELNW
ncbi:SpoIIE family protein phosphatase, partial [Bacillus sp. D-CC]